jgi:hypothetical protein
MKKQLDDTDTIKESLGEDDVYVATDVVGESTRQAMEAAQAWLEKEENLGG